MAQIPVVIFTNYTKEEILSKALALGAEEVIVKVEVTPLEFVRMMKERYLR